MPHAGFYKKRPWGWEQPRKQTVQKVDVGESELWKGPRDNRAAQVDETLEGRQGGEANAARTAG